VLALDAVWEPLDALDPLAKQAMVEAVTAAVSHDGRVSVAEVRTAAHHLRRAALPVAADAGARLRDIPLPLVP
jgi:hypothetical protein